MNSLKYFVIAHLPTQSRHIRVVQAHTNTSRVYTRGEEWTYRSLSFFT